MLAFFPKTLLHSRSMSKSKHLVSIDMYSVMIYLVGTSGQCPCLNFGSCVLNLTHIDEFSLTNMMTSKDAGNCVVLDPTNATRRGQIAVAQKVCERAHACARQVMKGQSNKHKDLTDGFSDAMAVNPTGSHPLPLSLFRLLIPSLLTNNRSMHLLATSE